MVGVLSMRVCREVLVVWSPEMLVSLFMNVVCVWVSIGVLICGVWVGFVHVGPMV